jgi:hypothetical protein
LTYIGTPDAATKTEWLDSRSDYIATNEGLWGVLGFLVSEARDSADHLELLAERAAEGDGAINAQFQVKGAALF